MKNVLIALVLIVAQQSALAATLNCTVDGGGEKDSFTIVENVPQVGLATLTWASGDSSVTTFLQKNYAGGCMGVTDKTYFHPYYTVNIKASEGLPRTRCAGMFSGYEGSISAEMQVPKGITCN